MTNTSGGCGFDVSQSKSGMQRKKERKNPAFPVHEKTENLRTLKCVNLV